MHYLNQYSWLISAEPWGRTYPTQKVNISSNLCQVLSQFEILVYHKANYNLEYWLIRNQRIMVRDLHLLLT